MHSDWVTLVLWALSNFCFYMAGRQTALARAAKQRGKDLTEQQKRYEELYAASLRRDEELAQLQRDLGLKPFKPQ